MKLTLKKAVERQDSRSLMTLLNYGAKLSICETHPTSDFLLAELRNLLNYLFGVCLYVLVQAHNTTYTGESEDNSPAQEIFLS